MNEKNTNCSCNRYGKKRLTKEEEQVMMIILLMMIVVPLVVGLGFFLIDYILQRKRSWKFHEITNFPKQPDWLMKLEVSALTKKEEKYFTIYTKHYSKEFGAKIYPTVVKKLREVLGNHFKFTIDSDVIPDLTCIISVPKRNFKCGGIPGEFIPKHGESPGCYFEYQMIGDDRIQVTWFMVEGKKYVAGICIYMKNPEQCNYKYREQVIEQLLKEPDYWSTYGLKEETMKVLIRKDNEEWNLFTNNRYGEERCFRFISEKRQLDAYRPFALQHYGIKKSSEYPGDLTVQVCKSRNEMVMIGMRDGERMHTSWNKKHQQMEYSICASCVELNETPPPTYQSLY
ncbi:hypothetical protein GCK72_013290 [Caenorhabditis remanei]|uniref:Uncharacterized protein n=1 Tax=Caenorhabditis remanei TaxID=31234 RepID=A0A6A5GQM8_CAERE|nr:hypothetical protein GCK72_013290 [Caenorhabditis remanei]KAF1756836.1 hypothetical protein GCK72_013290 [Caenorhabditis remanei]